MTACNAVKKWFAQEVRVPLEKWIEKAEEDCSKAKKWVEKTIRKPIEKTRRREQKRCREQDCNWWCLCCNRWFCWFVTLILTIVEWIVRVVGEWLVETICKMVVNMIRIVSTVVVSALKFIIVFPTCLVTEPVGALEALGDLWFDVVAALDAIGDGAKVILDAVSELLDVTRELSLRLADIFGPAGGFIFLLLAGGFDILRRIIDGIAQAAKGLFDVASGLLRLDFCFALDELLKGVFLGAVQALFGVTSALSFGIVGFRDGVELARLRAWITVQIREKFDGIPSGIETAIATNGTELGLKWSVVPLIASISSQSTLRELHRTKQVDLREAAGYAPIGCKNPPASRGSWRLVYKGTSTRVSFSDLQAFINEKDVSLPEFELLAGDKKTLKDLLIVARRKFRQMAIHLTWGSIDTFEVNADERLIELESQTKEGLVPFAKRVTKELELRPICDLPSVIVFGYEREGKRDRANGYAVFPLKERPSLATVRANIMTHVFKTVLAHEMGHCFLLRHEGHDGVENIMYTNDSQSNLQMFSSTTFLEYLILGGEPRFTLKDGINAWKWILSLEGSDDCLKAASSSSTQVMLQ